MCLSVYNHIYFCHALITVFEKRKGIYEKLSEYCTETALLGYYYSLMVFEKKIEESKMENDYNNGDTRKNLLEVIESVREDFLNFWTVQDI